MKPAAGKPGASKDKENAMSTTFVHTLRRLRGQILGWGLSLALYGFYLTLFYKTMAGPEMREQLEALIASYPPELFAFFGGQSDVFSPAGYLNLEFYSYMPLILGIFVILAGSGLFTADEENGTLDLVLAHPVSRISLFLGRSLGVLTALVGILVLIWLGFWLALPDSGLELSLWELTLPVFSLFAVLFFWAALSLLLSLVLPARRAAAMTSGLILVVSFFLTSMAALDERLGRISQFSPLHYYQGGRAAAGMEWGWFLGLVGVGIVCGLLSAWLFQRRDMRVGGEGGWRLSGLRLKRGS
jgi:ABC-2 type transport system permease protein